MKRAIERYLVNAGLTAEEYEQISGELEINNRQNLRIFSVIASAFLLFMFLLSFFSEDVASNRWVYMSTMAITLLVYVVSKFLSEKHPLMLLADMYLFMSVLYVFGIILGTYTRPDEQTVTFIALLLTVPLLFADRPYRMICFIYSFVIVFMIAALNIKEDYVLVADMIDACVFGTISTIISTYMMNVKCKRYLYEQKVEIMSETDLLTEVRSRNSYEQSLSKYPSLCEKSLTCIFVDVNGLHELNDTMGHEEGDKMLRFVAENLREQFGKEDTYRIGGDEFVAFVTDCSSDDILKKIGLVTQAVEEHSYHISVGYETGFCPKIDMDELIKKSETHMYENKRQFYQQKGIDRRTRK